jgi:hypothetical protein
VAGHRSPGRPDKAEVSGSSPLRPTHLTRSFVPSAIASQRPGSLGTFGLSPEELVHHRCSGLNHRLQLMPVDEFGHGRSAVTNKPRPPRPAPLHPTAPTRMSASAREASTQTDRDQGPGSARGGSSRRTFLRPWFRRGRLYSVTLANCTRRPLPCPPSRTGRGATAAEGMCLGQAGSEVLSRSVTLVPDLAAEFGGRRTRWSAPGCRCC